MDWRRYDAGTRLSQAVLQRWPLVAEAAGAVPHNPRHSTNRAPYRRAATYVDCVLRGEKPGDLPVQFPTKFEMIVNRRTAKALGLVLLRHKFLRKFRVKLRAHAGHRGSRAWPIA